jgi:anti-sigma factor ChrR (cupin superfamily)
MTTHKLADMKGGWFIGLFEPSLLATNQFEVAIKKYKAGNKENKHLHKEAVEFTVILDGTVRMNGVEYADGDIIEIEKNEATDFEAITDVTTVVVKTPSVANDKYIV